MKKSIASKVASRIFRKIFEYTNIFSAIPPYDYVQIITEKSIHQYLDVKKEDVKLWVIVGGFLGNEVPKILKNYPNCEVVVFECSKRYIHLLQKRFSSNPRVKIYENAVSDQNEVLYFNETNLKGSGSILKVGHLAEESYGLTQAESFSVEAVQLDSLFAGSNIDVLQVDVQGAELKVLKGAKETLKSTKAVLTEVSIHPNLYVESVIFANLDAEFKANDFSLALLGTDLNLTGNALYLKNKSAL